MPIETVNLFGIRLHRVAMLEAVAVLGEWMRAGGACRYVVTPNVDHVVKLPTNSAMQLAYRDASLVVADGWPLVAASRWLGRPLPERVAGSDLVPALFTAGQSIPDFRVFLLGAAPGVGAVAAERIQERWPGVHVCGVLSPAPGFERDANQCAEIVNAINVAGANLLVVGLGAPKQEIWLQQYAPKLTVPVAIAAGATIDFFAGVQKRAPRWVQQLRMEWMFRLLSNPKRLASRYAYDAFVFPRLVMAERRRLHTEGV